MMNRPIAKLAASMLAIAFMQAATTARAADEAAAAANATAADAPAAEAGTDSSGLTDIVVTATKRETNLQKTPIAIAVLGSDIIAQRHVQSLVDLADGAVPSLRVATFEARQSALTVGIRGIVPFDQNQTARDTGVGVYIDGVYLGRSQGLNAGLFDVERIEVLRGPQGTLFGRNTEGGAVSIVTKKPTGEFEGRVVGGAGNFGSYNGEIHLNLPAFANIAIKADGLIQHQNATVTNPLAGQYGWGYYNRVGGRITALWKPIDGFSAEISYDRAKDENTPYYSQLINYNPNGRPVGTYVGSALTCTPPATSCIAPLAPIVTVSGNNRQDAAEIGVPQQLSVNDTEGFTGTLKYSVSPALELRSITAWRNVTTEQWDNSGGAHRNAFVPNANFSRYSLSYLHQTQFSQELQAVGSIPHFDYAFGLYYFTEQVREYAATPSTNKWNATGTGYTINDALTWNPANWARQRDSNANAHSYAVFAQGTWSPTDSLHLTVGGRFTKDERSGALTRVSNVATNYPFTFDNSRFDPMVTLAYDATENAHLYAKFSTGYRAGGANDRSSNFGAFGPEEVKSYEIGAKMDLFDHKIRLNVAGYMMDRTGTQIDFDYVDTDVFLPGTTIPNPTFNLHTENTANAPGTSKIRGVEVELTAKPTDSLTLGLSYAYTYTDIPATPNPLPGPTHGVLTKVFTVFTPKNAISGSLDYETPIGGAGTRVRLHLDANYSDPVYSFQSEDVLTDSGFVVNGRLSLADIPMSDNGQRVTVAAWVRNLFDEAHIYRRSNANNNSIGSYANFNPPRTFGIEAAVKF